MTDYLAQKSDFVIRIQFLVNDVFFDSKIGLLPLRSDFRLKLGHFGQKSDNMKFFSKTDKNRIIAVKIQLLAQSRIFGSKSDYRHKYQIVGSNSDNLA